MTCSLYDIKISITLAAPYLVHGNDPGRFGLDATLLKDHKGQAVLPGTLVAGRIAETWQTYGKEFAGADADTWFGKETDGEQHRARLMVSDLTLDSETKVKQTEVVRTALDDDTGSVKQGALLVIEQIAEAGAKLEFKGTWQVWANDAEIALLVPQIRAALAMQTQWGAYRSVGFGRMLACNVTAAKAQNQPVSIPKGEQSILRLGLSFDKPLCVNSKSRRGNVFMSSDVIPGGTILGALAQTMLQQHAACQLSDIKKSVLAENFDKLRCTHALPANKGKGRPMPLPQSLVSVVNGEALEINDAYDETTPPALRHAPAFQTDWKSAARDLAVAEQGWGRTQKYLRVRTAMEGGKAKEGDLFAYECVYAAKNAVSWQCDLDLSQIDKQLHNKLKTELATLLGFGLAPIGKTDARAEVWVIENPEDIWASNTEAVTNGAVVRVVLRTDALLFTTDKVADQPDADLLGIYQAAFSDILQQTKAEGALELSHFFATQHLCGGKYLHQRYLYKKTPNYQPLVLTEAGSVFVFKVKENHAKEAKDALENWDTQGLPLPAEVTERVGFTWQDHPYTQKNGYGEVAINPRHPFVILEIK